jgi:hypothetical protein
MSGNDFFNNFQVKDLTTFNKVEMKDKLKVKGDSKFEDLKIINGLNNNIFSLNNNNEIIFDDDAILKLTNSPIKFKARDIFEIVAFLKYIIKVCGKNMERCDFNQLLDNNIADDQTRLVNILKEKFTKFAEDFLKIGRDKNIPINNDKTLDDKSTNNGQKQGKKLLRKETFPAARSVSSSQTAPIASTRSSSSMPLSSASAPTKISSSPSFEAALHPAGSNSMDNFKFKEEKENFLKDKIFEVNKEIEETINFEFKKFNDSKLNDYENFLNSPSFQDYAQKYYYGGQS